MGAAVAGGESLVMVSVLPGGGNVSGMLPQEKNILIMNLPKPADVWGGRFFHSYPSTINRTEGRG